MTLEETTTTSNSNSEKKSNFFSLRNMLFLFLAFGITIFAVVMTFINVLKISFLQLFTQISQNRSSKYFICWLLILIGFILISFIINNFSLYVRLSHLKIKIPLWQYIVYGWTVNFIRAVSPGGLFVDGYTLFWLRMNKLPMSKASAIMFMNTWIWQVVQILITLPSFIIICFHKEEICNNSISGHLSFWCMIVGMTIDFVGLIGYCILGFSKLSHYVLSRGFNSIKKLFHLKYHTKEETKQKYLVEATIQKDCFEFMKDWKSIIIIFLSLGIFEFFTYTTYYAAIALINKNMQINFWDAFNVINVAFTANKFIPIPGGEFSIELMLQNFLNIFVHNLGDQAKSTLVEYPIAIWRIFVVYIPGFIGMFSFGYLLCQHIKKWKNGQLEDENINF